MADRPAAPTGYLRTEGTFSGARRYLDEVGLDAAVAAAVTWATDHDPANRELAYVVLGHAGLNHLSAYETLLGVATGGCDDYSPDVRLLPGLLALRAPDNEPDDPWVPSLERAISACTPC